MFLKNLFKRKPETKEIRGMSRLEFLIYKIRDGQSFTDEENIDYYNLRLAELPECVVEKAVKVLQENLSSEMKLHIFNLVKLSPLYWTSKFFLHHGWGTNIRNLLRNEVCLDEDLPSLWGWDDYYTQLVEIAVGYRKYP